MLTFSRILSASILRSTSYILIYTWFSRIPVLLSISGPAFFILNSALLYSCNTYTDSLTRLRNDVIESAILIKLWCNAIRPASASLSKMIGASLLVCAISLPGKIELLIEFMTFMSSFSIWASRINPDFIIYNVKSNFQPRSSSLFDSISRLMLMSGPGLSLHRWIRSLKRWSWKLHGPLRLVTSHNFSRTRIDSCLASLSYKH